MSIARLKKAYLIGLTEEKPELLDQLQKLGLLHIEPLHHPDAHQLETLEQPEVVPERLNAVLRYLQDCPEKRRQVTRKDHFDADQITQAVERNQSARLKILERIDFLTQRIKDLSVWGNFRLPNSSELNHLRFWFYLVPNHQLSTLDQLELPWQVVHRDHRISYVIVVSEKEPTANLVPVPRTHTGATPLVELERELEQRHIDLEELDGERTAFTRWIYLLQCSIAGIEDRAERHRVGQTALDLGEIFAVSGWIDATQVAALEAFTEQRALALQLFDPQPSETPPTLLNNPELLGSGESIVHFFQVPGYHSWDPSRVVFFSFAAFFALIMSDAGYALLMLLGTLFGWSALGETQERQRLRTLLVFLSGTSLVWGILVGSYFGLAPHSGLLATAKLFDLNDFNLMMTLSISIGVIHLIIANLVMARVRWPNQTALASLGWAALIATLFAGWLLSFSALIYFAAVGCLGVILVFSGEQARWSERSLSGLYALTNLTKAFGDILSYLRLFALGLASASLALTFNQLAGQVQDAVPGMGIVLAGVILLLGHTLNFLLTVVSGVIHGLRLNLIEFYNWSLADEGYAFQPFAKREVSPWTT